MKRFLLILAALTAGLTARAAVEEGQFLHRLQQRDSVLVGDQLDYGFRMRRVPDGTRIVLPEWSESVVEGVEVVLPWTIDTLKVHRARKGGVRRSDLEARIRITSFDEGYYTLPAINPKRWFPGGAVDSLDFDAVELDVFEIQVDTASFVVHDIKGQVRYPVTPSEVFPLILGAESILLFIALLLCLVEYASNRKEEALNRREPAHIVALRKLDKFRGDKYWEEDKQKLFYSGVTDALREYIARRFEIGAMEMTTAEIFKGLSGKDITPELFDGMKELFERADFVKFARHVADRDENASVLPTAVRFVTETYQTEVLKDGEKDKEA